MLQAAHAVATRQEFYRWRIAKKGKAVVNMCAHLAVMAMLAGYTPQALANPTGGLVTAGSATITSAGNLLQINQASNRAIIEWGGFDIAPGETTQFIQPNAGALALNRVVNSNQASVINGSLLANGHVLVINPNGVLIGSQGNVDVAGFVASSADIDNDNFMNSVGAMAFSKAGALNAVVQNQGKITIGDEGLGLLVAPTVANTGLVQGNLAKIQLAAGDTFGVDLYGDGLLHLGVASDAATKRTLKAENTGTIVANAGKVLMTAAAASDVVNSVINTTGVVEAKGLVAKGGEIILTGEGADVTVAGTVDASGKTGGGQVKIGGDATGKGTLAKAATVDIKAGATLKADAIDSGNGGTIVAWSDNLTLSQGAFFVRGGDNGGNGGLVETSSQGDLFVDGTVVNALSSKGQAGDWLLDPATININTTGSAYNPAAHNNQATGGTANIAVGTLNSALANIILAASGAINFNTNVNVAASGVGITANAGTDINIANNTSIATNGGNLTFNAGYAFAAGNGASFVTNGGSFNVNANLGSIGFGNGSSTMTKGGNIALTSNFGGFSANSSKFGTMGGDFTLSTARGIASFQGTTINTTGGAATGTVHVADRADTNITATELGNGNNFYQGANAGNIDISAFNIAGNNNNNCFKAGGTAGNCLAVADPRVALTIQATAASKIYGNIDPTFAYTITGGALVTGDTLTGALARAAGQNVGSYNITQGTLAVNATTPYIYTITFLGATFTINPANLTVTAVDQSKTYGANYNLGTTGFTTAGLKYADVVTGVTLASTGAVGTAAKGSYAINASNAVGTGLSNYTISYNAGTLTVDPKALTITANNQSKTYGQNLTLGTNSFGTLGLVNSDTVTGVTLASTGAVGTAAKGSYAINASNAVGTGLSNYTISYNAGTLTVDPKALTITANNQSKTYGQNLTLGTTSFGTLGLVNSDTVTGVTLASTGAVGTAAKGTYDIDVSNAVGTGLSNYTIAYNKGTLTVDPKALTITANNRTKTYGDNLVLGTSRFTTLGLVNSDTVTGVTLASTGAVGTAAKGSYAINVSNAVGTGLSNYTITYNAGTLTVNPKLLAVTANSNSKTYGQTLALGTTAFSTLGLVNGDTVTAATLASAGALDTANVGLYGIGISNAIGTGLSNYTISYVPGVLLVLPKALTITANNQTKTYGDVLALGKTAFTTNGLVNSDAVTGVTLSSIGAAATANKGTYNINASNAVGTGLGNYIIRYNRGTLTVDPKALTITANNQSKTYGDVFSFAGTEFITDGLVNSDIVTSAILASTGAVGTAAKGTYDIDVADAVGTGLSNYTITYNKGALTVDPKALTITANNQSKTYGDVFSFAGIEFTIDGLVNSDVVTSALLTSSAVTPAAGRGFYDIVVAGATGTGLDNYNISYISGTFTVNRKAITVTANNQTKNYGTLFNFVGNEYVAEGLVNGDDLGNLALISAGAPALAQPGDYAIQIATPESAGSKDKRIFEGNAFNNYDITYINGTMNVLAPNLGPNVRVNSLGRPFFSAAGQAINIDPAFEPIAVSGVNTNLSLSLNTGNPAQVLANLAPAAGGQSAEDLANIETSAGGNTNDNEGENTTDNNDVACANDFLANQPCNSQGNATNI